MSVLEVHEIKTLNPLGITGKVREKNVKY
jgi:hypothetical protein